MMISLLTRVCIQIEGKTGPPAVRVASAMASPPQVSKADGCLPSGRATFAECLMEVFNTVSHLNRPGRGTSMMQRTPDFIGCGAVMIVGIKHAQVQGESSRVSYLFMPGLIFTHQNFTQRYEFSGNVVFRIVCFRSIIFSGLSVVIYTHQNFPDYNFRTVWSFAWHHIHAPYFPLQ